MLKRHVDQLMARLDELYVNGATHISWREFYHWHNTKRIAKTPWRDMKARWTELLEEKEGEEYMDPIITKVEGGFTLFFSREPKSLSEWTI